MLAENLLLLALDDERGTVLSQASVGLPYGLAGALVMELALAGCVDIQDEHLQVVAGNTTGHPVLDAALQRIADKPGKTVRYWVEHLDRALDGLKPRLLDALVAEGALHKREQRVLFVFKRKVYPERDGAVEADARGRIHAVLLGGEDGDARTRLLIQLAAGCNLIDCLYRGAERKQAKKRVEQLAEQSDPCADAVGQAAQAAAEQAQAAAMVAIMAASMAATTAATTAACSAATSAAC